MIAYKVTEQQYLIEHQGKKYGPEGRVDVPGTTASTNEETERAEIQWLQTGPDRVFLYVDANKVLRACCRTAEKMHAICCPVCQSSQADMSRGYVITTWPGTIVGMHVQMGQPYTVPAFGYPSTRRAVSCRLFGVLYHGTYYESSGDYCRLRKAKVQP